MQLGGFIFCPKGQTIRSPPSRSPVLGSLPLDSAAPENLQDEPGPRNQDRSPLGQWEGPGGPPWGGLLSALLPCPPAVCLRAKPALPSPLPRARVPALGACVLAACGCPYVLLHLRGSLGWKWKPRGHSTGGQAQARGSGNRPGWSGGRSRPPSRQPGLEVRSRLATGP